MSVNRNRALYNKATTNHEYLSMQDNFLFNDWYWEDSRNVIFLSLPDNLSPKTVEAAIAKIAGKEVAKTFQYILQPLKIGRAHV